jgi:hypothetical protein
MTSREHARRLMLILLSSEVAPRAAGAADARTERDDDADEHEDCSEGDRFRARDRLPAWT